MNEKLALATAAARAAGKRLVELLGRATVEEKGSSQNLVTQADLEAEEIITAMIAEVFPDHKFLREEGESTGGAEADHLWVIDPLDATNNYAHGIPHFAVSIAYAEKGVPQVGVILDPMRDELFTGSRGEGAFLNGKPIHVSDHASLPECIIGTGFYYDRGALMERTLQAVHDLFKRNIRGIRRFGSAAVDLCWVACGRFDGFFEYRLAPWDYAAGGLIVEEAGGKCFDRGGGPLRLDSGNVIVANAAVAEELRDVVRWSEAPE
jgi:myo-inositol-1(or 4)-monophosphatase